jgi:hypothetical protein
MVNAQLQVAVDIGSRRHRVAVGDVGGELFEEFDVEHTAAGLSDFFARVEHWQAKLGWPVAVAMVEHHCAGGQPVVSEPAQLP